MAIRKPSTKSPAFQFYPRDYLSDAKTRAMTFKQRGMYWDLVSHCWLEQGLPEDPLEIARILGIVTPQRFVTNDWPVISRCFRLVPGGGHQHGRLDVERRKQAEYRESRAVSGSLGGLAKASNARNVASKEASKVVAKPTSSSSSASATSDQKRVPRLAFGGKVLEVPRFLDEEFTKRLNGQAFDLLAFYDALDARLAQTGEPWDLKWIRQQFEAEAPQPQRVKPLSARAEPEHRMEWADECQQMHQGKCGGQMAHHTRKLIDEGKAVS